LATEPRYDAADWLHPPKEEEGLRRYVETIRERIGLVLLAVVITTAFSIAYVVTAPKSYEAEADVLVTPIGSDNNTLQGLGLLFQTSDPTRDVETAARFIANIEVAERVGQELGLDEEARDVLEDVVAEPVAQSNIVAVTGKGSSPEEARDLANAFADEGVAEHTETFHELLNLRIQQLDESGVTDALLAEQRAQLTALRDAPAPDLKVQTRADTPVDPSSPRPALSIAGGLFAGLVLGIAGAFAAQALDPRLRREEQLRRQYRLPILGRIPREGTRSREPIGPRELSAATAEAYRTLRSTLTSIEGGPGRVILVTGSSASEGKTTTAVNLASSLALAGNRVILIEADLRRPSLADALGIEEIRGGVVGVLIENTRLQDALTPTPSYGNNLLVLPADYEGGWIAELFTVPAARQMIEDARSMADYVIIDSPPLNEVVDALPLARAADDVLLVVRLGKTRLERVSELGELLAESGVRPVGFAVVGTARPGRSDYYYYRGASGDHYETAEDGRPPVDERSPA
jgi:capsular exopolysaccharide synthesis family protein